jgi:hypothetical protein
MAKRGATELLGQVRSQTEFGNEGTNTLLDYSN